jgi:DNA (cytosine-5)-methyltransferase 1
MTLTIGTDCSGIEAPLQALIQMKKKFTQEFASDINNKCRETSKANYPEEKEFYNDITKRNHKNLKKNLDLYVCGFPCQPFSTAGLKLGSSDTRSNVLSHCIKTIKHILPKIFILENVKQFKNIQKGKIFNNTIKKLESIKNNNKNQYNIIDIVLNAKHYGVPQNRERLFIIGIRKDVQKKILKSQVN